MSLVCCSFFISTFSLSAFCRMALKVLISSGLPLSLDIVFNSAVIFQYSCDLKSFISFSRSTIRRTATDWTRPALSPFVIFFHSSGLIWYPTRRSSILRACWALTFAILIGPGWLNASRIASFVISLKVTRFAFSSGISRA